VIDYGVLILAGGEATRLPGKLELDTGGVPMIARVARNFTPKPGEPLREIVLSCKATFPNAIDALLPFPAVVDRWPKRGPLGGMLTCFPRFRSRFVFVVAGDAPDLDSAFADDLAAQWQAGDDAVVPVHDDRGETLFEPLASLYDAAAFVRAGLLVMRSGHGSIRRVLDHLRIRQIARDESVFSNINTLTEYHGIRSYAHIESSIGGHTSAEG